MILLRLQQEIIAGRPINLHKQHHPILSPDNSKLASVVFNVFSPLARPPILIQRPSLVLIYLHLISRKSVNLPDALPPAIAIFIARD